MNKHLCKIAAAVLALAISWPASGGTSFAQKLPAAQAGTIPKASGSIAFIREGDIWVMDADGQHQMRVADVDNADGRLSWAPDGKRIAYTRSGKIQYQQPENSGGAKKLYDVFVAFVDSAKTGNTFWWRRLTNQLGGRDPEWSPDGSTIYFCQDLNANTINAMLPNYQLCTVDPEGGNLHILRKDWQTMSEGLMAPSVAANGDIAFVHLYSSASPGQSESSLKPQGISVLPKASVMKSMAELRETTKQFANCVAPAWSPDGKWLAYIRNEISNSALYIASPDLKQRYLVYQPPPSTSMRPIAAGWSPDSKWLTFSTTDGAIYICDITGNQLKRLSGPGSDWAPAWSKAAAGKKTASK